MEHPRHPPQRMKQLHCCAVRQFQIAQDQFYFLILKNPALGLPNRGNQNQVKALLQHSSPQHFGVGIFRMDKEQLVKSRGLFAGQLPVGVFHQLILQQRTFHFVHAQRRPPAHGLLFVVVFVMTGHQNKRQLLICDPHLVQKVHAGTVRQVKITADHQRHFLLDGSPRFIQSGSRFHWIAPAL